MPASPTPRALSSARASSYGATESTVTKAISRVVASAHAQATASSSARPRLPERAPNSLTYPVAAGRVATVAVWARGPLARAMSTARLPRATRKGVTAVSLIANARLATRAAAVCNFVGPCRVPRSSLPPDVSPAPFPRRLRLVFGQICRPLPACLRLRIRRPHPQLDGGAVPARAPSLADGREHAVSVLTHRAAPRLAGAVGLRTHGGRLPRGSRRAPGYRRRRLRGRGWRDGRSRAERRGGLRGVSTTPARASNTPPLTPLPPACVLPTTSPSPASPPP